MHRLTFPLLLLVFFACRQNDAAAPSQQQPAAAEQTPENAPIDTATGAPIRQPNPWADRGCELVTDAEIHQLFGVEPRRDSYNANALKGQGYCLRFWNKPDWKEREYANETSAGAPSPRTTLVTQVLDYGTAEMSRRQFESAQSEHRNGYAEVVAGLGDGALWSNSTTTLLVRKGHLCLQLSLDWADKPHDNLEKTKEIAALALKKM